MTHPNELNWWIDHTGSAYTHINPLQTPPKALAAGKVYLDSRAGVITHLNNKPADILLIPHELLDVLHARFPGTRWWVKDISPRVRANTPKAETATKASNRQAAS